LGKKCLMENPLQLHRIKQYLFCLEPSTQIIPPYIQLFVGWA